MELFNKIRRHTAIDVKIQFEVTNEAKSLILGLLTRNPKERLGCHVCNLPLCICEDMITHHCFVCLWIKHECSIRQIFGTLISLMQRPYVVNVHDSDMGFDMDVE